jgi:2',3'-cyclic-nucleotide 2'-phosphodiesterase (5'-nucleotidase family)
MDIKNFMYMFIKTNKVHTKNLRKLGYMVRLSFLSLTLSLLFSACEKNYEPVKITAKQHPIEVGIEADESLEAFVKPYREQIDKEMNKVLAYAPASMFKTDTKLNTPIGNMMADAVFNLANPLLQETENLSIDMVLLNFGGIRSGINAGNISTRTAYEIMPFENEVVVAKLAYPQMVALVDYLVQRKIAHPIAGLHITLKENGALDVVTLNGEDLDENKVYLVATSDYLLTGGDQMSFFENNQGVIETNYKLRNLFIDYFEQMDTIQPQQDQRFIQLKP